MVRFLTTVQREAGGRELFLTDRAGTGVHGDHGCPPRHNASHVGDFKILVAKLKKQKEIGKINLNK